MNRVSLGPKSRTAPILASALVAGLIVFTLIGVHLRSHQGGSESAAQQWPAGISDEGLKQLARHRYDVTTTSTRSASDEAPVVDAAVAEFGFVDSSQVKSVTLVDVADEGQTRDAAATPTWVVEFSDVVSPELGGHLGSEPPPGGMVVLVEPETLKVISGTAWQ